MVGMGPTAVAVTACHLLGVVLQAVQAQNKSATEDLIIGNRDRHHEEGSAQKTLGFLL